MANQTQKMKSHEAGAAQRRFSDPAFEHATYSAGNASNKYINYFAGCFIVVLLVLCHGPLAECALLSLDSSGVDIAAGMIKVKYDHQTDQFTVTGTPTSFHRDGIAPDASIVGGSLSINATINSSGVATLGSFEIKGGIPSLNIAGGSTLLKGTLVLSSPNGGFGYQDPPGGTIFNFRFMDDGSGKLSSYYPATVGVKIDASSINFNGSFTQNFATLAGGKYSATANAMAEVPGPASLLTWSIVGMLATTLRIRNRHKVETTQQLSSVYPNGHCK